MIESIGNRVYQPASISTDCDDNETNPTSGTKNNRRYLESIADFSLSEYIVELVQP